MKHKITGWLAIAAVMTSCGSKNMPKPESVFGDASLVEQIVSLDGDLVQAFDYNDQRDLVGVEYADQSSTMPAMYVEYVPGEVSGHKYDVKITNLQPETSLLHYTDAYFKLNAAGYAERCWLVIEDGGPGQLFEWNLAYSKTGELTNYVCKGPVVSIAGELQWSDGDIISSEQRIEMDGEVAFNKVVLHYISSDQRVPIDNIGCINPYMPAFGISMGYGIDNAYYAGMLGVSTKHLPLMVMSGAINAPERRVVDWLLNSQSYPVKLTTSMAREREAQSLMFYWMGQPAYVDPQQQAAKDGIADMYASVLTGLSQANFARYDQTSSLTPEFKQLWDAAFRESMRRQEMWIDYSPWIQGQDCFNPRVESVELISGDSISAKARVIFLPFDNDEQRRMVLLKACKVNGRWLVDDFMESDGTSVKNMAQSYVSVK